MLDISFQLKNFAEDLQAEHRSLPHLHQYDHPQSPMKVNMEISIIDLFDFQCTTDRP